MALLLCGVGVAGSRREARDGFERIASVFTRVGLFFRRAFFCTPAFCTTGAFFGGDDDAFFGGEAFRGDGGLFSCATGLDAAVKPFGAALFSQGAPSSSKASGTNQLATRSDMASAAP